MPANAQPAPRPPRALEWTQLPAIPDREGFAGSFAGTSGVALVVAGGANFPTLKPWEGGSKVWYDSVFVLDKPDGAWRPAGSLPRPSGYGVSVTFRDGIICAGGGDASRHHTNVFRLEIRGDTSKSINLASLPRALANTCGALLGDTLYVFGGSLSPSATDAEKSLFALDLAQRDARWRELEPCPGAGRILATAAAHEGALYIFSGAALKRGDDGKPAREWLRDAFRYTPGRGWQRLADLPRVAVAAPTPAPVIDGQILILGGDDGAQAAKKPTEHTGFRRDTLAYDPRADRWQTAAEMPFALVTTATALWRNQIVVPGGEIKPGVRSPQVWSATRP
jgi:N-acetylneuraminic acid mutarotase